MWLLVVLVMLKSMARTNMWICLTNALGSEKKAVWKGNKSISTSSCANPKVWRRGGSVLPRSKVNLVTTMILTSTMPAVIVIILTLYLTGHSIGSFAVVLIQSILCLKFCLRIVTRKPLMIPIQVPVLYAKMVTRKEWKRYGSMEMG